MMLRITKAKVSPASQKISTSIFRGACADSFCSDALFGKSHAATVIAVAISAKAAASFSFSLAVVFFAGAYFDAAHDYFFKAFALAEKAGGKGGLAGENFGKYGSYSSHLKSSVCSMSSSGRYAR